MSNWFLVYDKKPFLAAENMARDEFLFQTCHQKRVGFLRIYFWKIPTFSIGVSQHIKKAIDPEYITKKKFSAVRRLTGGKTVFHNDEITYAVISSEDKFYKDNDLYKSYLLIANILIKAFLKIDINVSLSSASSSRLAKSNHPCFSFPTSNEIEINGRKIVGSAQKRNNTALLQHGSIPITMDYEAYAAGAKFSAELLRRKMTTLSEISTKTKEELILSLIGSFQTFIGFPLIEYKFNDLEKKEIAKLKKKYKSQDWNYLI